MGQSHSQPRFPQQRGRRSSAASVARSSATCCRGVEGGPGPLRAEIPEFAPRSSSGVPLRTSAPKAI
eukprot:4280560-Alexandrium_andersonii.AAC.1